MSPEQSRAFLDSWLDHPRFCRESLTIKDKSGQIVPLNLTPAQLALHQAISRQERLGKPVRGIVLKARRVHISVAVCAQAFHRSFFPNYQSLLASHLDESAAANAEYVRHFDRAYRAGPGYLGVKADALVSANAEGLRWANGSTLRIATARNVDFSRGGTSFQFQHLTEFAFWPSAEATMRGLGQTIPSLPGTIQVIESSANGRGGLFYELWQDAQRRDSDRFALFFAWWQHPEYQMPVEDPARFQDSLTREERDLMTQYPLRAEQIAWRRWCIKNNCQSSLDTFHQEYPSCAEEAFLTSGRPVFDQAGVDRQLRNVQRNPMTGSLTLEQVGTRRQVVFTGREDGQGEIEIWRAPERGRNYVIGADAASGRDEAAQKGGASDPDFACACVLDAGTGEQVAGFRERWSPGKFADVLYVLGSFYNWAYLIPERNTYGAAVIESLIRAAYPTERLWIDPGREPFDRRSPLLAEIGFITGEVSKARMITVLDECLRLGKVVVRKAQTVSELLSYVWLPNAKMGGQGAHDDEVIALALAVQGMMRPEVFASPLTVAAQVEAEERAEIERYGAPHRRPGWRQ